MGLAKLSLWQLCITENQIHKFEIAILDERGSNIDVQPTHSGVPWNVVHLLTLNEGLLMKKVLLTTTVLALTASAAAADIQVKGVGWLGLLYDNSGAVKTQVSTRLHLDFIGSGETDGGLKFTFQTGIRNWTVGNAVNGAATTGTMNAPKFTIGTDTWELAAGNTNGAILSTLNLSPAKVGHINGWGPFNISSRLGADVGATLNGLFAADSTFNFTPATQNVTLSANFNGVNVAVSDSGRLTDIQEIAVAYSTNGFSVGLGYADAGFIGVKTVALSAGYKTGALEVNAGYLDADNGFDAYQLGASYKLSNGVTLQAAYGDTSTATSAAYGLGATYALGGGAFLGGGVGK
ncbi:MAG: hypothetical protein COB84_03450, partial [Rhodobacteraceae bacterium]